MAKQYTKNTGAVYNESELLIKFLNGSELMILGSDSPDSLRGIALWGCFLDEYPQQSPVVFTEIVSPITWATASSAARRKAKDIFTVFIK